MFYKYITNEIINVLTIWRFKILHFMSLFEYIIILEKIFIILGIIICIMNVIRFINSNTTGLSSADQNFRDSGWAGHQIGIISFQNMTNSEWISKKKKVERDFKKFSDKNSEMIQLYSITPREWLNMSFKNRPKDERTFCITIFDNEKTIIFLANHSLCDGFILYEILKICLDFSKQLITPKYSRKPIISELMIIKYIITRFIKNISYKQLPVEENNRRYSIIIPYEGKGRWEVFGKIFHVLYQSLDADVNTLRIAFTVAWEDPGTSSNNRIGAIIIDIPRCQDKEEYSKIIKKQILNYKYDALTSYEMARNYPIHSLRKKFNCVIDGVLTTLPIKDKIFDVDTWFGGFVGNLKSPFYLNAITLINTVEPCIGLSIQTHTPIFSHDNFMNLPNSKSYCDLCKYPVK
jgi:hypothetical protein